MDKTSKPITNSNSEALLLINSLVGTLAKLANEAKLMRGDMRYCLDRKVLVGSIDKENKFVTDYETWGGDVSNNGIALFVSQGLESGRVYVAQMHIAIGTPIFATILICRSQRLAEGLYRVGATFIFDDHAKP